MDVCQMASTSDEEDEAVMEVVRRWWWSGAGRQVWDWSS